MRFYSVYYQVVSSVLALFIDFAVGLNRMTVLLVLHRQLMSLPKSDKNLKQLKRQIGLHTVSLDRLRQIGLHLRLLTKNRPLADKFRRQLPLNWSRKWCTLLTRLLSRYLSTKHSIMKTKKEAHRPTPRTRNVPDSWFKFSLVRLLFFCFFCTVHGLTSGTYLVSISFVRPAAWKRNSLKFQKESCAGDDFGDTSMSCSQTKISL